MSAIEWAVGRVLQAVPVIVGYELGIYILRRRRKPPIPRSVRAKGVL